MTAVPSVGAVASPGQALAELRTCAEQLERGQADTPLQAELDSISLPIPDEAALVVVVAAEAEARAEVCGWLIRRPVTPTQVELLRSQPCLSIEAIRSSAADAAGDWAQGAASAQRQVELADGDLAPFALVVAAPGEVVQRTSWLLERISKRPTLLILAGQRGGGLSPHERQAMDLVAAGAGATLILSLPSDQTAPSFEPGVSAAGMTRLELAAPTQPVPEMVTERGGPVRQRLSAVMRARRALSIADMILERQSSEVRQLQARLKRDQRIERTAGPSLIDPHTKQAFDQARAGVAEELSNLVRALRDRNRRAGLRTGTLFQALDDILAMLGEDDLERETVGKKIRLGLRSEVADKLKDQFAAALKQDIQGDITLMGEAFARVRSKINGMLDSLEVKAAFSVPPPAFEDVWAPIEEAMFVDARYRGEMKKRGFLQRLGEGRRVVFVILMMGSLAGGFLGFNIRRAAGMGPVFLLLFIGTVAYTFHSWRQEDREIMEAEVARLREVLFTEFSRLLQDALRERQTRVQSALDDARREVAANLEALQRDAAAARASTTEKERKAARARLKVVETRLKELGAMSQVMTRARGGAERAVADAIREVQGNLATPSRLAPAG